MSVIERGGLSREETLKLIKQEQPEHTDLEKRVARLGGEWKWVRNAEGEEVLDLVMADSGLKSKYIRSNNIMNRLLEELSAQKTQEPAESSPFLAGVVEYHEAID